MRFEQYPASAGRSTEVVPSMTVRGVVSLDGDTIYVNGMTLANLLRAFTPPETGDGERHYRNLSITFQERP